jgi:hypothetical protein
MKVSIRLALLLPALSAVWYASPAKAQTDLWAYSGNNVTTLGTVGIGLTAPRSGNATIGWLDVLSGVFIGNNANIGGVSFASTTSWCRTVE